MVNKQTPSLGELAFRHLSRHPNDKSNSILAKMHRTYGRDATQDAIKLAQDIQRMILPEPEQVQKWPKLRGKELTFTIIDEHIEGIKQWPTHPFTT